MTREDLYASLGVATNPDEVRKELSTAIDTLATSASKVDILNRNKEAKAQLLNQKITGLYDGDSPVYDGKTTRITESNYYAQAPELKDATRQLTKEGINARIMADNYAMGVKNIPKYDANSEMIDPRYYKQYSDAMDALIKERAAKGQYNVYDTGATDKYGRQLVKAQSSDMPMSQTDFLIQQGAAKKVAIPQQYAVQNVPSGDGSIASSTDKTFVRSAPSSSIKNGLKGFAYTLTDSLANTADLIAEGVEYATTDKKWADVQGLYTKERAEAFKKWTGYNDEIMNNLSAEGAEAIKQAREKGDYWGLLKTLGKAVTTPELILSSLGYVGGLVLPGTAGVKAVQLASGVSKAAKAAMAADKTGKLTEAVALANAEKAAGPGYKLAKVMSGQLGYASGAEQFGRDAEELYKKTYNEEMPTEQKLAARGLGLAYVYMDALTAKAILLGKDPITKAIPDMLKKLPSEATNTFVKKVATTAGVTATKAAGMMGLEGVTEATQTGLEKIAGQVRLDKENVIGQTGDVLAKNIDEIGAAGLLGAGGGIQMGGPKLVYDTGRSLLNNKVAKSTTTASPKVLSEEDMDAITPLEQSATNIAAKVNAGEKITAEDEAELKTILANADIMEEAGKKDLVDSVKDITKTSYRDKLEKGEVEITSIRNIEDVLELAQVEETELGDIDTELSNVGNTIFTKAAASGVLDITDDMKAKAKKLAQSDDEILGSSAEAITEATTAPEAKPVETKESLAKELNEERKKVFKQVVKDFYSVEIEATTGSKRGFRPKIEALEATLNAAKPSTALIKKQLKSLTGMQTRLSKAAEHKIAFINELQSNIDQYNRQGESLAKAGIKGNIDKTIEAYKKKYKFTAHLEESDGKLSIRGKDNILKTYADSKQRYDVEIKEALKRIAPLLEKHGISAEETGITNYVIFKEPTGALREAIKAAQTDIAKQQEKAKANGGVVKLIAPKESEGYIKALVDTIPEEDQSTVVGSTTYSKGDIAYVTINKPRTKEDLAKLNKSLAKGGELYKQIKAAKDAGATIVIDKSVAQAILSLRKDKTKAKAKNVAFTQLSKAIQAYKHTNEATKEVVSYSRIGTSEGDKDIHRVFKPTSIVAENKKRLDAERDEKKKLEKEENKAKDAAVKAFVTGKEVDYAALKQYFDRKGDVSDEEVVKKIDNYLNRVKTTYMNDVKKALVRIEEITEQLEKAYKTEDAESIAKLTLEKSNLEIEVNKIAEIYPDVENDVALVVQQEMLTLKTLQENADALAAIEDPQERINYLESLGLINQAQKIIDNSLGNNQFSVYLVTKTTTDLEEAGLAPKVTKYVTHKSESTKDETSEKDGTAKKDEGVEVSEERVEIKLGVQNYVKYNSKSADSLLHYVDAKNFDRKYYAPITDWLSNTKKLYTDAVTVKNTESKSINEVNLNKLLKNNRNSMFTLSDWLHQSPAVAIVLDKDGNINETVALAMQLSVDEVIAYNGRMLDREFKSKEDIAQMFGILETDVTNQLNDLVKDKGMLQKTLANKIGALTLKRLGITFDSAKAKDNNIEKEMFDKLEADIGNMALQAMSSGSNKILEETSVDSGTLGKALKKSNAVEADEISTKGASAVTKFYRLSAYAATEASQVKENGRPKRNVDLDRTDAFESKTKLIADRITIKTNYRHTPVVKNYKNEKVEKDVIGLKIPTGNGMLKGAVEFLNNLVKIKWIPDTEVLSKILEMNENNQETLLKWLGYKTEDELTRMTSTSRANVIATNREILSSIDALTELQKDEKATQGMYFDWFYTINGRYMIDSNTINPQADKLHRFIVQPLTHKLEYVLNGTEWTANGKPMNKKLNYSIAQAFGFKVDKKYTADLETFAENVKDNIETIETAILEGNEEKLNELGISIDHISHAVQAIETIKKMKAGKSFESRLTAEFDALTSGFGLKLLQLPILGDVWKWLNKTGIFKSPKVNDEFSIKFNSTNDVLASGMLDSYQDLSAGVKIEDLESAIDESNNAVVKSWFDILSKQKLLPVVGENGVVSSALRSLFKDPFMTFNYSAGIKSIKESLATKLTYEVLDAIAAIGVTEDVDQNPEYKKYNALIASIRSHIGVKSTVDVIRILRSDDIDDRVNFKKIESTMITMFEASYGKVVENIMTKNFSELMKANDAINSAFKLMFSMFNESYQAEKAKLKVGELSEEQFKNILVKLADKFPMIKGPLTSGEGSRNENIAIYKWATVTPTEANTRYKPAQTIIDNTGRTSTVRHMIKDFEASISAGSVVPIHYIDGAIMAQLANYDITAIHDAIMPQLDKAESTIQTYNKAVVDVNKAYSVMEAVYTALTKALEKTAEEKGKSADTVLKNIKVSTAVWAKEKKEYTNSEKSTLTNIDTYNFIQEIAGRVKEARSQIFEELDTVGHMVGIPGSMYSISNNEVVKNTSWSTNEKKLGAGDIYSQVDLGVSEEEIAAIEKANTKFFTENPSIKVVYGNDFNYKDGVITIDKNADKADQVVYTAHEIIHAKTYEWMSDEKNQRLVNKLKEAIDKVFTAIDNMPAKDATEEIMLLQDRLKWANGKSDDNFTRTVENVAVLASEPAMRATLLKLLPKNEQTLIDRILNKVKEWLGMEIQIDGERILKLVDRIVRNAEKKEAKTDHIAYIQKNIGNLVMPMEIVEKLEKKVISKEALDKIVEMLKCKGS